MAIYDIFVVLLESAAFPVQFIMWNPADIGIEVVVKLYSVGKHRYQLSFGQMRFRIRHIRGLAIRRATQA
jgi:hypothetical protein